VGKGIGWYDGTESIIVVVRLPGAAAAECRPYETKMMHIKN